MGTNPTEAEAPDLFAEAPGYATHEVLNQAGALADYDAYASDEPLREAVRVIGSLGKSSERTLQDQCARPLRKRGSKQQRQRGPDDWWRGDDLQGSNYQQYMAKLAFGLGGPWGLGLANNRENEIRVRFREISHFHATVAQAKTPRAA
jgi:hypothetical protein